MLCKVDATTVHGTIVAIILVLDEAKGHILSQFDGVCFVISLFIPLSHQAINKVMVLRVAQYYDL